MIELRRLREVAREELNVDPRKVVIHGVSRILPQHALNRVRTLLLRALGVRVGAKSCCAGPVKITGPGSVPDLLSIGTGCYLSGPLHIDLAAGVRIGARVYVGYDVMLITADHERGRSAQRCGTLAPGRPIDIGDGVWIGSRAVILPGVRVGHGAVVAAGAVVTGDVAPNTLVAGVPARRVRDLGGEGASSVDRRSGGIVADEVPPPSGWVWQNRGAMAGR
jgi:maltose O-acetyltransferase